MKTKTLFEYLIGIVILIGLAYIVAILFGYEGPAKSKFTDIYGGINPYSKAYQLSDEEIASRKGKKILNALFIFVPIVLVLYFVKNSFTKSSDEIPSAEKANTNNLTDDEEIRLSFVELAIKMVCTTEQVKRTYEEGLESKNFDLKDLMEAESELDNKKLDDAKMLGIKPENTPSALLAQWTKEFRIANFKSA
ncbi:MAG: hypothetical protein EOP00_02630 [Pedobacter sp.]|nr:MAG: hypothetical protein EOP00_02630 [Pedobacter sp.]